MTTTPKPPIQFAKVEALRRHMLLTTTDMAKLFGVTRMTYYSWVNGSVMRSKSDEKVRAVLKRLLGVMTEHNWPMPEVIAATQAQRKAKLDELLEQQGK